MKNKQLEVTTDFQSEDISSTKSNVWFFFIFLVFNLLNAVGGALIAYHKFPQYKEKIIHQPAEKVIEYINVDRPIVMPPHIVGILEVRDGQAITILKNQVAINGGNGYIKLQEETPYQILSYFNHGNDGCALVDYGNNEFFWMRWYAGTTKAPTKNPKTIYISNRRVEIGSP